MISQLNEQVNKLSNELASAQKQESDMRSGYEAKVKELQEQLVQAEETCTAKLKQLTEKLHEAEATLRSKTDQYEG